jgi:hypothetical protein
LLKAIQNNFERIKETILPESTPVSVKAILVLFYLSTFTVGIDLSKEMAKGEFEFFESVLTESVTIDTLAYLDNMIIDPHFLDEVQNLQLFPPSSDVEKPYQSRAPPVLPAV